MKCSKRENSRIAVTSDTNGNMNAIQKASSPQDVDCILHCGDFGFYDQSSYDDIPLAELRHILDYAELPDKIRRKMLVSAKDEMELRRMARENRLLGDFEDYLTGMRHFSKPIYVIWGNHDDADVIRKAIALPIKNLFVLTPMDAYDAGDFVVIGCGGKIVLDRFFTIPYMGYERIAITGDRFSPRPSLLDFITLLSAAQKICNNKPIVSLFHHGSDDDSLTREFIDLMTWDVKATSTFAARQNDHEDLRIVDSADIMSTPLGSANNLPKIFDALCERYPVCRQYIDAFRPIGLDINGGQA